MSNKRIKIESSCADGEGVSYINFARAFPHIEGNWPSRIFLSLTPLTPMQSIRFGHICSDALEHFLTTHPYAPKSLNAIVLEANPHISLTRSFILRYLQISRFEELMKNEFPNHRSFAVDIDCRYQILVNDAGTRAFLCLVLTHPSNEVLISLVGACDKLLQSFSQPKYYDDPIFHISIASWILDGSLACFSTSNCTVVDVPSSFSSTTRHFNFQSSRDDDDDMADNYNWESSDNNNFETICRADEVIKASHSTLLSSLCEYGSDDDEKMGNIERVKGIVFSKTMRVIISKVVAEIGNKTFCYDFKQM